jgi:hypothetical protein
MTPGRRGVPPAKHAKGRPKEFIWTGFAGWDRLAPTGEYFDEPPTVSLMGAGKKQALRVSFDGRLKLEFHGANITSDAGLLAYRELDEALELTARSGGLLDDWRTGELFPRVGFIVTNLDRPAKRVVRFYNQRGTAEQWIKEGKNAARVTRTA